MIISDFSIPPREEAHDSFLPFSSHHHLPLSTLFLFSFFLISFSQILWPGVYFMGGEI